jgi:hypothetical protein
MTTLKKISLLPVAAFSVLSVGALAGYASLAGAQTTTTDSGSTTTTTSDQHQFDSTRGGHVGANGTREELLTGDLAARATAAATAAEPGATIERVETDAEGAAYEAHMVKSDGARVTVKFDSNFNVTATEDGFGKPLQIR